MTTINAELRTRQHAAGTVTTNKPTPSFDRRYDLDALRAIAMLLGIVARYAHPRVALQFGNFLSPG